MSNIWDIIGNSRTSGEFETPSEDIDASGSPESLEVFKSDATARKRNSKGFDNWLGLKELIDVSHTPKRSPSFKKEASSSTGWKELVSSSGASDWYGNMTDKLVEKVVTAALPTASITMSDTDCRILLMKERPQLSIPLLSRNFRKMTSRMTVIFDVYFAVFQLITWRQPAFSLSVLLIYSYCCLHPRIIPTLPFIFFAYGVLTPSYLARHPPDPCGVENNNVPSSGPPLRPAPIAKPVPDISREFYMNVVDTQNAMADYSDAFDLITLSLEAFAYYVDESRSALAFVLCLALAALIYITLPWIPWGIIFTALGWIAAFVTYQYADYTIRFLGRQKPEGKQQTKSRRASDGSPARNKQNTSPAVVSRQDRTSSSKSMEISVTAIIHYQSLLEKIDGYAHSEFPFNETAEHREIETFEIQAYEHDIRHWSSSVFVPESHVMRRFLQPEMQDELVGPSVVTEVLAPNGWSFCSKTSWTLDFLPEDWVMNRFYTSLVEVDHDEKWVYDCKDGQRLNTWRRRRWHRSCERTTTSTAPTDSPKSDSSSKATLDKPK